MTDRENRTGLYEMPNQPEIPDLFRIREREVSLQLRSHSVARVITYNPATQTADLSVDILQIIKDLFTPATPAAPNPVKPQTPVLLKGIKVAWPRTSLGYMTFPIVPGDTGELHVQDRSIQEWRLTGLPSDPKSAFAHMLGDSVFHPNLFPDLNPIVPPTSLVATVIEGPLIFLGPLAASPIAKGTELNLAINTYTAAVTAANTTLNGLAVAWAGLPGPAQVAFAAGFAAWNTAIAGAQVVLIASLTAALSLKSFTE